MSRIKSRGTYFKEIQRRAGKTTDADSQRTAERRRQSSNESSGLLGVETNQYPEHKSLTVKVCHEGRYVNQPCQDGRHQINELRTNRLAKRPPYEPWKLHACDNVHHPSHASSRKDERKGSPPMQRRMPNGFFGVFSHTMDGEKSRKKAVNTVFCIHCGKHTSKEHAEEHKFQQMADEFDQQDMSEVEFITTTPIQQENPVEEPTNITQNQQTEVAEEEATQKMREDLIRQANWMKLQKFMYNEASSEEEVIRAWCENNVKTNTSFRFMRANPVQAQKIVAFLLRIKDKIKDDQEMMRAWRERLQ